MYTIPDCHGVYCNEETGVFFCMATKQQVFSNEAGDVPGAVPVACLSYGKSLAPKGNDAIFDQDTVTLAVDGARSIIANANEMGFDVDIVRKAVEAKNASIRQAVAMRRKKRESRKKDKKSSKRPQRVSA